MAFIENSDVFFLSFSFHLPLPTFPLAVQIKVKKTTEEK
jgi:hypothetical protein